MHYFDHEQRRHCGWQCPQQLWQKLVGGTSTIDRQGHAYIVDPCHCPISNIVVASDGSGQFGNVLLVMHLFISINRVLAIGQQGIISHTNPCPRKSSATSRTDRNLAIWWTLTTLEVGGCTVTTVEPIPVAAGICCGGECCEVEGKISPETSRATTNDAGGIVE